MFLTETLHRFFDGRYMFTARLDEQVRETGRCPRRTFSHVMFLLEPRSGDGTFEIECRITVRGRDHESTHKIADMTDDGLDRLRVFIEQRFLAFAQVWFSDNEQTHVMKAA